MAEVVIATVESAGRDGWDILSLVLGVVAFTTGTITFVYWAMTTRRRPEFRFLWEIRDEHGNWKRWDDPSTPRSTEPGSDLDLKVSIQNIGDAPAEGVLANFVVPAPFQLAKGGDTDAEALDSKNRIVGEADHDRRVWFFPATVQQLSPSDWHSFRYQVTISDPGVQDHPQRLMLAVSHPRLNATGRRWMWSLLTQLDVQPPDPTESWPTRQRRRLRRIRVPDHQLVGIQLGERQSIRRVTVASTRPDRVPHTGSGVSNPR